MPVQVNEIIIRAVIDSGSKDENAGPGSKGVDTADIVSECVEQVMQILKEKEER